jgi:hypothetical protein
MSSLAWEGIKGTRLSHWFLSSRRIPIRRGAFIRSKFLRAELSHKYNIASIAVSRGKYNIFLKIRIEFEPKLNISSTGRLKFHLKKVDGEERYY